eukprot:TRINITY_DN19683_c0_g1_i1.p1 TRINITY_DN19683_c0_g1~~TRINITY_DN19683_c0_g1_i1.p1  ORF type:complete len:557 (+),score=176.96 TRINITY_DN19683_c0_g1_i1:83-1753(+)
MNDYAHVQCVEWRRARRNDPSYMSTRTRKKLFGQFKNFSVKTPQGQIAAIQADVATRPASQPLLCETPYADCEADDNTETSAPPSAPPSAQPFVVPTTHSDTTHVGIDGNLMDAEMHAQWDALTHPVAETEEQLGHVEALWASMKDGYKHTSKTMVSAVCGEEEEDVDETEPMALTEDEFVRFLSAVLHADRPDERARQIFDELKDPETKTVAFDDFAHWVEEGDSEEAEELERSADASFYAGLARAMTSMTRPLSQSIVYGVQIVASKFGFAMAKYMANPIRLFKRAAVGTLEIVSRRNSSMSIAAAVSHEFSAHGWYGVLRLTSGPYIFNALVSLSMFQTYENVRSHYTFENEPSEFKQALKREAFAGTVAGVVQAVMNTPVYNIKRKMPGRSLTSGASEMFVKHGTYGLFENLPLMVLQESFGLGLFFSSYECYKAMLRDSFDEKRRVLSLVFAGMLAGMTLTTATHPIDNLHEWHTATRNSPRWHPNVLIHFVRAFRDRPAAKARRMLFKGLARRVPLGIPAGIPLLVYELMIGHEGIQDSLKEHHAAPHHH